MPVGRCGSSVATRYAAAMLVRAGMAPRPHVGRPPHPRTWVVESAYGRVNHLLTGRVGRTVALARL